MVLEIIKRLLSPQNATLVDNFVGETEEHCVYALKHMTSFEVKEKEYSFDITSNGHTDGEDLVESYLATTLRATLPSVINELNGQEQIAKLRDLQKQADELINNRCWI